MAWGTFFWVAASAAVLFVLSLAVIATLLIQLPATFFLDSHVRHLWIDRHPVIRWSGWLLKNLLGVLLILLGGVLSLPGIPGQGLLTILLGIVLLDFPGRRKFERGILRRPGIHSAVNRLRQRYGKPPLLVE